MTIACFLYGMRKFRYNVRQISQCEKINKVYGVFMEYVFYQQRGKTER